VTSAGRIHESGKSRDQQRTQAGKQQEQDIGVVYESSIHFASCGNVIAEPKQLVRQLKGERIGRMVILQDICQI